MKGFIRFASNAANRPPGCSAGKPRRATGAGRLRRPRDSPKFGRRTGHRVPRRRCRAWLRREHGAGHRFSGAQSDARSVRKFLNADSFYALRLATAPARVTSRGRQEPASAERPNQGSRTNSSPPLPEERRCPGQRLLNGENQLPKVVFQNGIEVTEDRLTTPPSRVAGSALPSATARCKTPGDSRSIGEVGSSFPGS